MIFKWANLKSGLIRDIRILTSHMTFLPTILKQTKSVSLKKVKSSMML